MFDASEEDNELLQRLMLLKNGSQHPALPAYVVWHSLNRVHRFHADDLRLLKSLADGDSNNVDEPTLARLLKEYRNWFDGSRVLTLLTRDVINSSVRSTREGFVVVEPFSIRNNLDQTALELAQRHDQEFLRRLFDPEGHFDGPSIE